MSRGVEQQAFPVCFHHQIELDRIVDDRFHVPG
jgi:hypothetical protein